ncbi:unnamed protein product [Haemonchus placei]|uniref:MARVEL domain-containing protein n=1 Tax=Haemonchus placei TaxID=6290 RepID=A0A158QKL8_HAEPC|nr:unnamed protein product [Haemonchus placei]
MLLRVLQHGGAVEKELLEVTEKVLSRESSKTKSNFYENSSEEGATGGPVTRYTAVNGKFLDTAYRIFNEQKVHKSRISVDPVVVFGAEDAECSSLRRVNSSKRLVESRGEDPQFCSTAETASFLTDTNNSGLTPRRLECQSSSQSHDRLIAYYRELYLTAHILPAVVFGMIEVALFFIYRAPDEFILCSFAIVMQGPGLEFLLMSVLVICTLVILCYLLLICFLKQIRTSSVNIKNIYRSVLIITLAVIFGYFSAVAIVVISDAFLHVDKYYLNLFSGVIACFSTSITFFVYYIISSEYREAFDDYLGIGQLKKLTRNRIGANSSSVPITLNSNSRRVVP